MLQNHMKKDTSVTKQYQTWNSILNLPYGLKPTWSVTVCVSHYDRSEGLNRNLSILSRNTSIPTTLEKTENSKKYMVHSCVT